MKLSNAMNILKVLKNVKVIYLLVIALISSVAPVNAAENKLQTRLQDRIERAQIQLNKTEKRISYEREELSKELNKLELEVLKLRKSTTVAQRLSDERTLSLSKLEQRIEAWRKQDVYQQNMLHRFLQQHYVPQPKQGKLQHERIHMAVDIAKQLEQKLRPRWNVDDVVMPSGKIEALSTLNVGPVTWYWNEPLGQAGLASVHDESQGLLHSDLVFSDSESSAIAVLKAQSSGEVMFDPTLSRAIVKEQNSESLLQHVMKGGLWAIPIILFALFALLIALIKSVQLIRLPAVLRFTPAVLSNLLSKSVVDIDVVQTDKSAVFTKLSGMQKSLLDIALSPQSTRQRDDLLFMQLQDHKLWLERWIGGIAVTAAISPLLGLLGTVSGMIETFKMMTLFGSGDPAVVSGGIAQALVTTELGLVVAIPALILNAVLSRRAKAYYSELEGFAILLSKADEEISQTSSAIKPSKKQGTSQAYTKEVAST